MQNATISFPLLGEGFKLDIKSYLEIGSFRIHWYGIIIAIGFVLAVYYAIKRSKQFGLTEDNIIDMLICAVPLAIIGARAYYVIFSWEEYKDNFVDVFKIWQGGLAIYGGVIGAVVGLFIFSKWKKVKVGAIADVGGLGLLIGQAIGRWGNFINREAYGVKTTVAWRMGLTNQYGTFYYHPCFLYESLWNIIGFVILHFYSKKRKFDGEVFLLYLAWYGLGRAMIESLRTDSLYLFGSNLRVSQLVALLCVIGGLGAVLFVRLSRNPEPEDMWVNRDKKAAMEAAAVEAAAAAFGGESEEEVYDEDFASALELLKKGSTLDDSDDDGFDAPVVEPVDVNISEDTSLDDEI